MSLTDKHMAIYSPAYSLFIGSVVGVVATVVPTEQDHGRSVGSQSLAILHLALRIMIHLQLVSSNAI